MTRFELLLGLGALMVAGAGTAMWLRDARPDQNTEAKERGKAVLTAASDWKREHSQTGCPSITQLRRDAALQATARAEDPWGQRFRIRCTSGAIEVLSAGGDGRFETPDDITLAANPNS